MATLYSTLYDSYDIQSTSGGLITSNSTRTYRGLYVEDKGKTVTFGGSYDLANGTLSATNTQLFLCGLQQGVNVLRIGIWPSGDIDSDNDFTFNLGTVASATAWASASTALQAVTGFSTPGTIATDTAPQIVIGANESLILTRQAGSLNATGIIYWSVTLELPA